MSLELIITVAWVVAFLTAVGIGANDSANAWATVYMGKVLTLRQIVIVGGLCEFLGAVLLGAEVSKSIGSSTVKVTCAGVLKRL